MVLGVSKNARAFKMTEPLLQNRKAFNQSWSSMSQQPPVVNDQWMAILPQSQNLSSSKNFLIFLSKSTNMINPILFHKLKSSAVIIAYTTLVSVCYQLLSDGYISFLGATIGFTLGIPLAFFEEFVFPKRMKTHSFSRTVITKTATDLGIITLVFLSFSLFVGWLAESKTLEDFINEAIYGSETYQKIGITALFFSITIFFIQLNKLLGPGVLLNYVRNRPLFILGPSGLIIRLD